MAVAPIIVDVSSVIVAIGGMLIGITAIVAPLYFKLVSDSRAAKDALENLRLSQEKAVAKVIEVDTAIREVAHSVNGKMTEMKDLIEKASHAEGRLEGQAEERANPQVPAITTVKDDSKPEIPPAASAALPKKET